LRPSLPTEVASALHVKYQVKQLVVSCLVVSCLVV
jgi:hypothetical protein